MDPPRIPGAITFFGLLLLELNVLRFNATQILSRLELGPQQKIMLPGFPQSMDAWHLSAWIPPKVVNSPFGSVDMAVAQTWLPQYLLVYAWKTQTKTYIIPVVESHI